MKQIQQTLMPSFKISKTVFLWTVLSLSTISVANAQTLTLAANGKSLYNISTTTSTSDVQKFASQELKKFLDQISGANFEVTSKASGPSIIVATQSDLQRQIKAQLPSLAEDGFGIFIRDHHIYLVAQNQRAALYAVYAFLNQLGCHWVAPAFEFYEGVDEYIPSKRTLTFSPTDSKENPVLKYRKLYIEEGLTHNTENLLQLIDWMPKARFNILVAPIDYEGHGNVRWDNWRKTLTPELEKRGIAIEVGGHGYQNFLNANMEEGQLFERHPEWFGLDDNGNRSKDPHRVFCTSNNGAVAFLQNNVLNYLTAHPEIDIFDFWPPDAERWCTCEECKMLGSPTDRHAILVSQTSRFLKREKPELKLECLAYSRYVAPPEKESIDKNVLLDFCPINQSFEYQIFEDEAATNKAYDENLNGWLEKFDGDISLYSYYRKYAWKSLPNIIPHYMQSDLQYYRDIGVKGISVYSEPGDWFTYGVNHYTLSRLSWNPDTDVDRVVKEYSSQVYGREAELAVSVYDNLEKVVRFASTIPFTKAKTADQYRQFSKTLNDDRSKVLSSMNAYSENQVHYHHLSRLALMLEYALKNIDVASAKAAGTKHDRVDDEIRDLITSNAQSGVFVSRYKEQAKKQTPNIILIVADDLGYGDLGCYGATKVSTPAIDKLAEEGMVFKNAFVTSSLCTPSRYSIMTGRYAWRTDLEYGVLSSFGKPMISEDETTLASMLKRNGYRTACVGKWHLGFDWSLNEKAPANPDKEVFTTFAVEAQDYIDFSSPAKNGPIKRGFDYFYGMAGSNNMQPYVFIENDHVVQAPSVEEKEYDLYASAPRAPNWIINKVNMDLTHKAVDVINDHFKNHKDQPFFFYFPTSAIHRPCLPTFTKGKSKAGLRGDIIEELDWTVSEIINALKQNNVYDNTLLIFTSDNGPRPGDPALWIDAYAKGDYEDFHQPYFDEYHPEFVNETGNRIWKAGWFTYDHPSAGKYRGFKSDAWDGGFRVPFIVRWPKNVEAGARNNSMISTGDLLATIAELVGDKLKDSEGVDSYSFLKNIFDANSLQVRKSLVVASGGSGALVVFHDDWKYIEAAKPGRWPETYYPNGPSILEPQLYNTGRDPEEQNNLYQKDPQKVEELIQILNQVKSLQRTENK